MNEGRIVVRRRPSPEYPERPWRAELVTPPGTALGDVTVGRYGSMIGAVMAGVTAARFVSAGIPWRAEL